MGYRKPYYNEDHKLVRYHLSDFIADTAMFFRRFFSPVNIRHAFRSVITGFGEYAVFFAALIVIQSFFWILQMDADLFAREAERNSRDCPYSLILEGYTENEWANLNNEVLVFLDKEPTELRGYESYEVSKYYGKPGEVLVRVSFLLTDDSEEFCSSFLRQYRLGGENVTCTFGERTLYRSRVESFRASTLRNTVFCGILSVIILLILFLIRVNQFRFRFGIYMSFGADFEKLVETCAWEMFAIAVLTFFPSLLVSGLLFFAVTGQFAFFGIFSHLLPGLLWVLCVVFAGVIPAVKIISASTPVSMLVAADNANLVSSPMRSFRIFGKTFPLHYELFGILRFRKYYAMLLSFCVLFTTLFSCGIYMADMKETAAEAPRAAFEIISEYGAVEDDIIEEIDDLEGVRGTLWSQPVSATAISSFIVLNRAQASGIGGRTVEISRGYADNNFRYLPFSSMLYSEIERSRIWQIDGDLESVCDSFDKVAVSCTLNNQKKLNFKVGDRVTLASLIDMDSTVKFDRPEKKYVLQLLVEGGDFSYQEVEIAAVVDDGYTGDEYSVYLSDRLFEKITKRSPSVRHLEIFTEEGVSAARSEELRNRLCSIVSDIGGARVRDTGYVYELRLDRSCFYGRLLLTESFALLLISPLVWFYSQMMFGKKREKEMYMISAMGGTDRDLLRLFGASGLMLAVLASVATGLFTTVLTYLIYYVANVFLPSLGFGENVRYDYSVSPGGFALCFLISVVSAVLSTVIPFFRYRRERDMRFHTESTGRSRARGEEK